MTVGAAWPRTGLGAAAWLACLGQATPGHAQPRVAIPGGVLRGTVTDTVRKTGLSYALVTTVSADRRAFANEGGGFAITGLKPGAERVRVQQIGYAPVELNVILVESGRDSAASDQLVIALGAKVQVLPELNVTAGAGFRSYRQPKQCVAPANALTGANAQLVIDQAVTNADRILALELGYPLTITYEHVREAYDSEERLLGRWVDTIVVNPATRGYRPGEVLTRGRRGRTLDAMYFTMGDLARDEFQRAHCVWYVGPDSAEAGRVHRVDFEPAPGIKTTDWAGSFQFDEESFQLVRSDAWLVRVQPRAKAIRAARCAVRYGGEIPTIVHEQLALCLAETDRSDIATSRDIYRVIATRFLGAKPGDQR